ncbi:MAG: T9SS type A sorting domain-containing protein [Ignavibacteria bacterium]|nr:T9SS type A sorting domain-containing protein [Ignavibacteria bacterium]
MTELKKVEITNPLGQIMKNVNKDELTINKRIDVRELQNGTYYVLIQYRNSIIRIPLSILR